ncbi:MAG: amidohydrolase family protein [Solirubrobacteraceae bacterium]
MTVVDVHAHVIPAFALEAADADDLFGVRREDGLLVHPEGFRYPVKADFAEPAAIVRRMDAGEIACTIVSLSPTMFFYDQPASDASTFARSVNDAIAEMVAGSDGRLLGLAQLSLQDPRAAVTELRRAVLELGMRGALIGTNVEDRPLDDPALEPVLAAAAELGVPLELHPYFTGVKPRLEPFYLTNSIGNPLDTCIAAARLIHSGTLDRHPGLRLVLAHGGGFLPYQLGRLDWAFEVRPEPKAHIERRPSDYLDRFWFDTLVHGDAALAFLRSLVGPDRLVLGTDLPYDMGDPRPLARLRRSGVDPDRAGLVAQALFALPTARAHVV